MNIIAKLKAMQRELEALRARVDALDGPQDPWLGAVAMEGASLTVPIVDAKPIDAATIAPPPKMRPTAKSFLKGSKWQSTKTCCLPLSTRAARTLTAPTKTAI